MTARKPVVRAMKARRASRLSCGCYVRTGEYIIRGLDSKWRCARCVIATLTASKDVSPGTRPGEQSPKEIIT